MKFTALAARVDMGRQVTQQRLVEIATRKRAGELSRIDAHQFGAQAGGEHVAREVVGGAFPERKQGIQPGGLQLLFAVGANIPEEEIAERDGVDALRQCAITGGLHALLIDLVGAGPGQGNDPQRQLGGRRLCLDDRSPRSMHRHAVELRIQSCQKAGDIHVVSLSEDVKRPRAVFSTAPGEKDTFHARTLAYLISITSLLAAAAASARSISLCATV